MLRCLLMAFAAGASLAAEAKADPSVEKEVARLAIPRALTPVGKRPLFLLRGEGVQVYRADAKLAWVFQGPEATLRDYRTGEKVGTHGKEGKGPVWTDAKGSKVTGMNPVAAPAPNPTAIPWLLLEAKNNNGGRFAKVSRIQRVDTWAGQMPTVPPAKEGDIARVAYHATYVFWSDAP